MTTETGKSMRLKRVIDPEGVLVICALDHGMTSPTFLEPLADIEARTRESVAGGANVIMMSKGMIRIAEPAFSPTTSLALLLSASADPGGDRPEIVQIADVAEALVLGADAVGLFTALGGDGVGRRAREELSASRVHVHCEERPDPTRQALCLVAGDGERTRGGDAVTQTGRRERGHQAPREAIVDLAANGDDA